MKNWFWLMSLPARNYPMAPTQTGHSGACGPTPEVQLLANDWNRQRPDALLQQDNQGL